MDHGIRGCNMKKIFTIIILFLLCGCSSEYTLEISNDNFKENIKSYIYKSEIPTVTYKDIELDDYITPFLKNKYSALFSNDKAYYKKVTVDLGDRYEVNMSYEYNAKKFSDSNSLKLCFDNYKFDYNDNYYIHAYGTFYCLYSNELKINIKTNNKVIKNNADSINGNVYTWNISDSNKNNVDIEFEVEKGFSYIKVIYYIIGIIALVPIAIIVYMVYSKNKNVNEI